MMYVSLFLAFCTFTYKTVAFDEISLKLCNQYKSCFTPKEYCNAGSCDYAATWAKKNDYLEIELLGYIGADTGYVAIGFSKDAFMGDDTVIGCYVSKDKVVIQAAHNPLSTHDNEFIIPPSDYLQDDSVDPSLGGTYDSEANRIYCRFRRKLSTKTNQIFDLTSGEYYILLARGRFRSERGFLKHFAGGAVVSTSAIFEASRVPIAVVANENTIRLAKAHGCFMILAWVLCSSIGILMARYYKDILPNRQLGSEGVWFQIHRVLQLACWLLVLIGFIVIFIANSGRYSHGLPLPLSIHPVLGIIIFILTFINPFVAIGRCNVNDINRPWFNWIHFIIGTLAYILAVPTMMLGLRLNKAGLQLSILDYPMIILVLFVIFHIIVEFTLECHGCRYYSKYRDRQTDYKLQLEDYYIRGSDDASIVRPKAPHRPGRMFRYFIAGLHATICVVCSCILVIAIIVN